METEAGFETPEPARGLGSALASSVARGRSNLKGKEVVMYFCIQNTDIAPERNERRLGRKGIESVRSFKKERKKKLHKRSRLLLFVQVFILRVCV